MKCPAHGCGREFICAAHLGYRLNDYPNRGCCARVSNPARATPTLSRGCFAHVSNLAHATLYRDQELVSGRVSIPFGRHPYHDDHLYRPVCHHGLDALSSFGYVGDRSKDSCRNNRNVDSRYSSFRKLRLKTGKWRQEGCQDKLHIPLGRRQEWEITGISWRAPASHLLEHQISIGRE